MCQVRSNRHLRGGFAAESSLQCDTWQQESDDSGELFVLSFCLLLFWFFAFLQRYSWQQDSGDLSLIVFLSFHECSALLRTTVSSKGIKTATDMTTTLEDLETTTSESKYALSPFQLFYRNFIILNVSS